MMIDRQYVEKATATGCFKVDLLEHDPARYFVRAILAGMYLSIVVFVYWNLVNDLAPTGFGKLIASLFFGVGLGMIVLSNTELFTSNAMYLAISSYEKKTSLRQTLWLWGVCFVGNLAGAVVIASLLTACGLLEALPATHALFNGAAHKVELPAWTIFWKGVLANWIVCLAVRLALRCQEDISKIMIMILVVFMFLYLGGEHSIANMGTFADSLMGNGPITAYEAAYNLLFATLGNIVGGVLFIALPFAYINPQKMG